MPSYYPEGNAPRPGDTEIRSLNKIASLCHRWALNRGLAPSIPWLGGPAPKPADTEVVLLQKIAGSLHTLSGTS